MKIEVVKLLSPTNTNYLKDDCNDIIADVPLLAEVEAIIWIVWQQGRHVEHHLVTSLVNLLSSSFCSFLRYKQSDFTLPNPNWWRIKANLGPHLTCNNSVTFLLKVQKIWFHTFNIKHKIKPWPPYNLQPQCDSQFAQSGCRDHRRTPGNPGGPATIKSSLDQMMQKLGTQNLAEKCAISFLSQKHVFLGDIL